MVIQMRDEFSIEETLDEGFKQSLIMTRSFLKVNNKMKKVADRAVSSHETTRAERRRAYNLARKCGAED